jgi:hypothetical protein
MMPGKGKMTVTGNLRDVMKESISAAASYVRSRAVAFGIEPPLFDKRDIHVHVPEGATPKDGPSAGVAMVTAIVSVMTGIPVRRDVAMTGEITLRGRVWPIAGLKEKLLAALRGGIKTVLIPEENVKDLVEIADSIKSGLEIVPVSRMDEVLARAMTRKPEPIEWDETTTTAAAVPEEAGSRRKPRRHRASNDRDTGVPRQLSLLKTSSTRASLVIPTAHWAETCMHQKLDSAIMVMKAAEDRSWDDGTEHNTLQSEAGYIDARPLTARSTKTLATHGRTIHWVISDIASVA